QVYYNFVVNDTLGWTRLSGTYIAEGDEQYITIGNFFQPGEFMEEIFPDCNLSPHAYYYIEDVKVEPIYNDEIYLEAEICEGECYTYNGIPYCNPGTYEIAVAGEECYDLVHLTVSTGQQQATAIIA